VNGLSVFLFRLLGAIGLGWLTGWFRGRQKEQLKDLKQYKKARERIDEQAEEIEHVVGDDPAVARELLRERAERRDLR